MKEGARTLLVVIAHPDDAELTVDGTIAGAVRDGHRAILVVATNGARGGKVPGSQAEYVMQVRESEQRRAAKVIGFADVVFLGFEDGDLREDESLREALVEQIRRHRPDVAIFMDPLTVIYRDSYVNHRDHRVLGMAMLDSLYPQASNAGYFPEQIEVGLQPHKVPEAWLAHTDRPNFWVDVSDTLDIRFEALRCHTSQMALWPDNGEAIITQQRAIAAAAGIGRGMQYAEEYRRVVVNSLS